MLPKVAGLMEDHAMNDMTGINAATASLPAAPRPRPQALARRLERR
ncbi:hypothetical protein GGR88_001028 [Sphingomonas jejuensis]|uniref:Uncharacterized protein n=1 Tax=Sphingomonas jejuensis TaxID=904715 RepID=A0ABX0XJN9_9SPHN|nr:hypothetical protein [Sphingomonas jejuensis]